MIKLDFSFKLALPYILIPVLLVSCNSDDDPVVGEWILDSIETTSVDENGISSTVSTEADNSGCVDENFTIVFNSVSYDLSHNGCSGIVFNDSGSANFSASNTIFNNDPDYTFTFNEAVGELELCNASSCLPFELQDKKLTTIFELATMDPTGTCTRSILLKKIN